MKHLVGILGYKSQPALDRCAASVLSDMPDDTSLIIVGNGPDPLLQPPGTVAHYVHDQTHGGFTAGLNWFLAHARTLLCDTATFLNDDLELEPGCLRAMIVAAEEPGVALACPMQVAMCTPSIIICGGTGAAYPAGMHRQGQRGAAWGKAEDVRWMPFAAVTFNLRAVADIGQADNNMTLWFSDSDYCIRARLHGYRVRYLGDGAVVRHEQSASINTMDEDDRRIRFTADQLAFHRKWGGGILADYST